MKGLAKWSGALLFILIVPFRLCAQTPLWRVDLRDVGYQFEEADTALKFYGQFLVVYSGSIYSGSMRQRLVFSQDTGQLISEERLTGLSLPRWDECRTSIIKRASPASNTIDCRNQMRLEQIGGIGRASQKALPNITYRNPEKRRFCFLGEIAMQLTRGLWVTIAFFFIHVEPRMLWWTNVVKDFMKCRG